MKPIKNVRKSMTSDLKMRTEHHLHGSGYTDDTRSDNTLQLVILKRSQKFPSAFNEALREGIDGFVDYGVITDAYGGGLMTIGYDELPIEDLFRIHKFSEKLTKDHFKQ